MTQQTIRELVTNAKAARQIQNTMYLDTAILAGVDVDDLAESQAYIERQTVNIVDRLNAIESMADAKDIATDAMTLVGWQQKLGLDDQVARIHAAMTAATQRIS